MDRNKSSEATIRHRLPDRVFHWAMALSVVVLLVSAFLPIIGVQFDWIPWHWIAGVVLGLLVLFHIFRVMFVHGLSSMLPRTDDLREVWSDTLRRRPPAETLKPAKYDVYQKSYHWGVATILLALIASGLPMLIKLDTLFWQRNPGLLSDIQWGYVYVVHGIASLLLVFMVLLHVYFSLLPEHKTLLVAMLKGNGPANARGEKQQ